MPTFQIKDPLVKLLNLPIFKHRTNLKLYKLKVKKISNGHISFLGLSPVKLYIIYLKN